MYSRRLFMGGSAAALGLTACGGRAEVASGKIDKVGIQTYTLREIFEPDPVGTLNMIKDVGYDYVELNGRNFSERSPTDLAAMIKDAGLYSPATHVSYDAAVNNPEALAKICQILGCDFAIIPWVDEGQRSKEDWVRHAAAFNAAGEIMKDNGVRLAYHNHQFEFDDLGGGETAMDILLDQTSPDNVHFELDLFWSALASIDVPALFKKAPGRFKLCHIKDMKGDPKPYYESRDYGKISNQLMVNVGEGTLPFETYFALNDVSGMEYFITEHDNPVKPFRKSIKTSYDTVRAMRF
ncbi:sugar phosphate isomerase/epimerase family protein [Hellea balneolensis]|uniref:sugar phosphate isomerase/epimerase family protein n=1 Tax=Hellea balneolensis TaxID=287478 RepID=UPI0003FAD59A|nr:sugar phosphate isomerase/epimerase [Hellea balneolensis]